MHLGTGIPETPDVMIVAPPSLDRASMFSICFLEAVSDYDILMDTVIDADGVTLPNACTDKMDMIGVGGILDAVPHSPHSDFDLLGVSVIDTDDVTLYDACTYEMDMIGIGRILCRQYHSLIIRGHFGLKRLILLLRVGESIVRSFSPWI